MKISFLTLTAFFLVFAGCFCSCGKEEIDMSKIDFSNIENLYEQPLPVIQKVVQGKWKVYAQHGGLVGINYLKDTYIEINDNHWILTNPDGQYVYYFMWKRYNINNMGWKTWAICDKRSGQALEYFYTIKNDTLSVLTIPPPYISDYPACYAYVRVN
jgi:hypothetical protein